MASSHASNADGPNTTGTDASNPTDTDASTPMVKRGSGDVGWEYGMLVDPNKLDRWVCKLCKKEYGGGVYRIKCHIAHVKGNVVSCPKATEEDKAKCKAAIEAAKIKKGKKSAHNKEIREEVEIESAEIELMEGGGVMKKPRTLGLMDKYVSAINVDDNTMDSSKKRKQQSIKDALLKERTMSVHQYMARWVYESGIPFNAVDNDSFKRFVEAVGQFGPGYQPAPPHLLREKLLVQEVDRTKTSLKKQVEEWERNGCSIMTDAWSDRKRRSIMNLCVNCMEGTTFLSSKEASNDKHTGQYIFEYVDKCIDEVGAKNVVQVVTDNASNNMAAATLLRAKRPSIFWTPCAAHTLNLMLEGISKLNMFKNVINKAKNFTVFIYSHHKTLALMRRHTKKEIVRPGVTRFASSFLTLQSMWEKRQELRLMIMGNEWMDSDWSKTRKAKGAYATLVSQSFWSGVALCLKVFTPLVKVLKVVDGDKKPSMGFVYGEMLRAKEEIKQALQMKEDKYKLILDIIDSKGKGRIDTPIHMAAYVLNPFYFFKDSDTIIGNPEILDAIVTCAEKFFPDVDIQDKIVNVECLKYTSKEGSFGRPLAAKGCETNNDNYNPVGWWTMHGAQTPNLQRMAKRILALTTSSSGCERNWSVFEGIHTKKRNKLDTKRMNKLVYVQFNSRLMNKRNRRDKVDILLSNEATNAQSWLVDGVDEEEEEEVVPGSGVTWELFGEAIGVNEELEPRRSQRNVNVEENVREPDEDDFASDDTNNCEEEDLELDSDRELDSNILGVDEEADNPDLL